MDSSSIRQLEWPIPFPTAGWAVGLLATRGDKQKVGSARDQGSEALFPEPGRPEEDPVNTGACKLEPFQLFHPITLQSFTTAVMRDLSTIPIVSMAQIAASQMDPKDPGATVQKS
jgi:hypothetical protein